MYKTYFKANSLLVGLILISGILSIVFFSRDHWLHQEKTSLGDYHRYLSHQLKLKDSIKSSPLCTEQKSKIIKIEIDGYIFRYGCEKQSVFVKPKPTKEKYIPINKIEDWLDTDTFKSEISYITSLSELPQSTEKSPKIVITKNAIDERLDQHFYGIIITEHYFDITGSKKIYGALYSSFDNEREERNLTFRKAVIDNIDNQYAKWHLLPYSRSLFINE